ncbi:MAG: VanZ family protein [Devosia nanyangense]|uniref:VanZ family protein n=1 Tax=Devosia nanyangense TaxID=1228055 RepID=A0A933L6L8_9HYPH|nr:VanZ family protein [Devosia nanyangense]
MRLLRIVAWALLAGIVVATLAPIQWRPETGLPVAAERFFAFFAAGLVFTLAYRRHFAWAALLLIGAALALELGQLVVPTRHGGVFDLEAKVLGSVCGVLLGWGLGGLWRRPDIRPPDQPARR